MLEHIGRTSGRPRFVCLEVVDRPSPRGYVLASGFGERAQWYRNLQADPRCWLTIGSRPRRPAHARFMDDSESEAALARYRSAHPEAWRRLRGAIERITSRPVTTLPMVEVTID